MKAQAASGDLTSARAWLTVRVVVRGCGGLIVVAASVIAVASIRFHHGAFNGRFHLGNASDRLCFFAAQGPGCPDTQ